MKISATILSRHQGTLLKTNLATVEEIPAKEFILIKRPLFSSAELWNIQRRKKMIIVR